MSGERSAKLKAKFGKFNRFEGCGSFKNRITLFENEYKEIFSKIAIRGCQFEIML